jgi:hypothetical protein
MLIAALFWYTEFRGDLEGKGYEFNPYDPCVANNIIEKQRHTVRFHVDNLMCSHKEPKVNDDFVKWLNKLYGNHGKVTVTRGDIHDYLGMTFNFSVKGKVMIDMIDYMESMVDDFSTEFKPNDTAPTPAAEDLFAEGTGEALESNGQKTIIPSLPKDCSHASAHVQICIPLLQCYALE